MTAMKRRITILAVIVCLVSLGGCQSYTGKRQGGDYYNSTKTLWRTSFSQGDVRTASWGSLGQTIGFGGSRLLLGLGNWVMLPVGAIVHDVEKFTLAPLVDTLYLPLDLYWREAYEEKKAAETEMRQSPVLKEPMTKEPVFTE